MNGQADVTKLREIELDELDGDDDFSLGLVVRADDLFGDADLVRGIADRDRVESFEGEDVARLDHRAHDVGDLLGIAVRKIERLDDEIFVVASRLRVIRNDDDRLLIEHFVEMVGGLHHALERLLRRHIA